MATSNELRIGLIGCGRSGGFHAGIIRKAGGATIVVAADPNPIGWERVQKENGAPVRFYADPGEMLDCGGIDAVYVCGMSGAEGTLEKKIGKTGLPVFFEKPVYVPSAQAGKIAKYFKKKQIVSLGFNWRYMQHVDQIREFLKKDPAVAFQAEWKEQGRLGVAWNEKKMPGVLILKQSLRLLDLGLYLLGPVTEVSARIETYRRSPGSVPDMIAATLKFKSGALGEFLHTTLLNRLKHRIGYNIICRGIEILGGRNGEVEIISEKIERRYPSYYDYSYVEMVRAFIRAAQTGRTSGIRCTYAEGINSIRLGEAIYESARTGKPVRVKPG